eukprot:CAMPEP_0177396488 /NCGR_PEP_ID=MMETSP0368-20130122/56754_1 /TAXON_ID=447022 ORGANISM="Scrippsiella hangoei-like, Strain SHHI-4" /NCGR_SAMPLE_ID=MMETSP0368 /ASSEMBLY_ACC=CAM_ASM_000363 /LENGTH=73 /DNA_ID=CAMNT_0018863227 /DNA_START=26 /DNA_END=243 /DNA_ORIENTATION=-
MVCFQLPATPPPALDKLWAAGGIFLAACEVSRAHACSHSLECARVAVPEARSRVSTACAGTSAVRGGDPPLMT